MSKKVKEESWASIFDLDWLVNLLRRLRAEERSVRFARLSCALGAVLGPGVGTGYWFLGIIPAALALYAEWLRALALGCLLATLLMIATLIDSLAVGSNPYSAILIFGGSAVLFALGFLLVLGPVRRSGAQVLLLHSPVRHLRRQHDVDGLIAVLRDRNPDLRAKAVVALAKFEDPRAEEPLLHALGDRDSDVRTNAIQALGRLRSELAVEPLIDALSDADSGVRHAAARALGQIGDQRAVRGLTSLLDDEDEIVQDSARDALHSLGARS
jgi:hypothetical protein